MKGQALATGLIASRLSFRHPLRMAAVIVILAVAGIRLCVSAAQAGTGRQNRQGYQVFHRSP